MNAEEVLDTRNKGRSPAGYLFPQPRSRAADTFPQAVKKVCARVYHFAAQRRERLHNAGNNLRNCLHDFNYDRRQILNERHEKLNARHNDLVDVADQRVYNAAYDLRDRLNDRRYNLRQCLYERDKKINARLNDKRYVLRKRRDNAFNDLRDRFNNRCDDLRKGGN